MSELLTERLTDLDSHEALIAELRVRGLPTYMATNILEKLITDRDAATAQAKMQLAAVRTDG